jgi:hypothetical protein
MRFHPHAFLFQANGGSVKTVKMFRDGWSFESGEAYKESISFRPAASA